MSQCIPPRSAILVLLRGNDIERALAFESHVDCFESANRFKKAGFDWVMLPFEYYPAGEKPADLPLIQQSMFGDDTP